MFVFYDLFVQVNIISRTSNGDMRAASAREIFMIVNYLFFFRSVLVCINKIGPLTRRPDDVFRLGE